MLRRLYLIAVLVLGCLSLSTTAAYAATGGPHQLTFDSWPVVLAGIVGVGATHVTEVFTHYDAPQWVKSGVNLALVALAGVLITIQVVPGHTWKDYVGEILVAWIASLTAHASGITAWIESLTANVGIGKTATPIVEPLTSPR
jgi:hypothetical protein